MNGMKCLVLRCMALTMFVVPSLFLLPAVSSCASATHEAHSANKTMIFVVDVSGSMRSAGLAAPVVKSLTAFIGNEFADGDNLVLCSFGDSFYRNKEVIGGKKADLPQFLPVIEGLDFTDDWTYMTLALSEVAKVANDLRDRFPGTPIYIYLYTDGKNEPPKFVSNPMTFESIMTFLFTSYQPAGTYLYVVTLGTAPDKEVGDLVTGLNKKEAGKAQVVTVPKGSPPPAPPGPENGGGPGPVPIDWPKIIGGVAGLLAVLLVLWWLLTRPKFPRNVYLSVLDEGGNVLNRYNLKSRQKFANSKLIVSGDLPVRGVARDCFVLTADKGGAVSIRANLKQNPISMVSAAMELKPGGVYALTPGDEFTVSGVKMRYGKGV